MQKNRKNDGLINWEDTVESIYNKYRAFFPWPGSFSYSSGKRVVIESMKPNFEELDLDLSVGEFKYIKSKKKLFVKARDGFSSLDFLSLPDQRSKMAQLFWNGQKLKEDRVCLKMKHKIAVAASGSGRSLANLIKLSSSLNFEVSLIILSRIDCKSYDIAQDANIPILVESFPLKDTRMLEGFLKENKCELVVLAGFLNRFQY